MNIQRKYLLFSIFLILFIFSFLWFSPINSGTKKQIVSGEDEKTSYRWKISNVYADLESSDVRIDKLWQTPKIKKGEPITFYFLNECSDPTKKCRVFVTLNHIQIPSILEENRAMCHDITNGTYEITVYPEESGYLRTFVVTESHKRNYYLYPSTRVLHSLKVEVKE